MYFTLLLIFLLKTYKELSNADDTVKIVNSISDRTMEVFGIVSSFHIAQLQMGISKPVRIGQAKNIKVKCFAQKNLCFLIYFVMFFLIK